MKTLLVILLVFILGGAKGQQRDTIKVILSVSDTSTHSFVSTDYKSVICGDTSKPFPCDYKHDTSYYPNSSIYWVTAYEVRDKNCCINGYTGEDAVYQATEYFVHVEYLDANKKPFPSNIVIWQQK